MTTLRILVLVFFFFALLLHIEVAVLVHKLKAEQMELLLVNQYSQACSLQE